MVMMVAVAGGRLGEEKRLKGREKCRGSNREAWTTTRLLKYEGKSKTKVGMELRLMKPRRKWRMIKTMGKKKVAAPFQ